MFCLLFVAFTILVNYLHQFGLSSYIGSSVPNGVKLNSPHSLSFQNMQYQSKGLGGLFSDRYERSGRDSHDDRAREDVPGSHPSPRYQNKSSYIERNKEKRGRPASYHVYQMLFFSTVNAKMFGGTFI